MRLVLLLCVMTGLLSGCRKKTSAEFYKLDGAQSVLIARDGDDAFVSPEMDTIIAGLQAVPEDSVEKPRAIELATKLASEKARVAAQRVPKAAPPPQGDPFAGRVFGAPTPVAPPPEPEPIDAGDPDQPSAGMDEKTFERIFGTCFTKGPDTTAERGVPAKTKLLKSSPDCQKRLGTPGASTTYLFVDGGVWGTVVETRTPVDAGPPVLIPGPPPAAAPDAGEPILTIPGAPLPDGYQKAP